MKRCLKKYWLTGVLLAVLAFLMLAPSCDRIEEAHGFVKSGKWIVGNGVIVGVEQDGANRFGWRVTCQ